MTANIEITPRIVLNLFHIGDVCRYMKEYKLLYIVTGVSKSYYRLTIVEKAPWAQKRREIFNEDSGVSRQLIIKKKYASVLLKKEPQVLVRPPSTMMKFVINKGNPLFV